MEAHNFVKSIVSLAHGRYNWLLQPNDTTIVLSANKETIIFLKKR